MKISIYGYSLPRMVILLTIILATSFINAIPGNLMSPVYEELVDQVDAEVEWGMLRKISITLDLSRELPRGIEIFQDSSTSPCNIYAVNGHYDNTHKIGDVMDGGIVVIGDDNRNVDRRVYLYNKEDGMRVVSITDLLITGSGPRTEVTEMVKLPEEPFYEPLVRIPLEIDLLEKCPDQIDKRWYQKYGGVGYKIQRKFRDRFTIGVVKYRGLVVDDRVNDDVVEREVILRTDGDPRIYVTTHTKDGRLINKRYLFVKGKNGRTIVPLGSP